MQRYSLGLPHRPLIVALALHPGLIHGSNLLLEGNVEHFASAAAVAAVVDGVLHVTRPCACSDWISEQI